MSYIQLVAKLLSWCQENYLYLNITKQQEELLKKARQGLYSLRKLRQIEMSFKVFSSFYSVRVEVIVSSNIMV